MSTKRIGDRGEDVAAAHLEAQGLVVLERQYRFERAEVDLVCFEPATAYEQGGELVFVEVKTRTGLGYGRPEEAVTEAKQRQVIRAAQAYLHERRLEGSPLPLRRRRRPAQGRGRARSRALPRRVRDLVLSLAITPILPVGLEGRYGAFW